MHPFVTVTVCSVALLLVTAAEAQSIRTFDDEEARAAFSSGDKQYCSVNAQNERELEQCLSKQAEYAEHKLNETYKKIMAQLPSAKQGDLRQEQRKWIKWREAECAKKAKEVEECINGCGVPWAMHVACMADEANNRTQQLKSQWQQ